MFEYKTNLEKVKNKFIRTKYRLTAGKDDNRYQFLVQRLTKVNDLLIKDSSKPKRKQDQNMSDKKTAHAANANDEMQKELLKILNKCRDRNEGGYKKRLQAIKDQTM